MSKVSFYEEDGKKFLKISVSKAKQFKQCKKAFKFNYIDHLPKITRDYHVLGTFCHEVLEKFHKAYIDKSELAFNDEMNIAWKSSIKSHRKNITPEIKAEAKDMIGKYLKLITEKKNKGENFNVISVEDNFKKELDGKVILNGMIDRIQQDPDGVLHVADYKTTKNKKYLKDDWFQLLTYCYVLLMDNPSLEKIRASYILLRHDFEYIGRDFTREEILETKNEFMSIYEEMIKEEEFPPSPTFLCSYCDFLKDENGNIICEEGAEFVNKTGRRSKKDDTKFGIVSW